MNFHPNDRLANILVKKERPMLTIPVLDVQKQLDDKYQDQIETLNLQILDLSDALQMARDREDRLRKSINGLQANMAGHTTLMNDRNAAVARCTSMESQVKKLEADLKTEIGNRDHFRSLVAQQDAFIKEAKRQIEEFKRKKEAELKSKQSEAEHLAKQAIRLNEENSKLRQENTEATSKANQLNTQTPLLMEENRKYREQTTRLIEEKRKLQDKVNQFECRGCQTGEMGEYCGGCVGCLMRQAEHHMHLLEKQFVAEQKIGSFQATAIGVLTKALDAMKLMPCLTWRQQGRLYRDCKNTIAAINGQIDSIREEQKKG